MDKNIFRLIKIQLSAILTFGSKKGRKLTGQRLLMAALLLLIGGLICFYSFMLTFAYVSIGMGDIIPPLMYTAACIVVLFTSILKTGGLIFKTRDYDLLSSLPIRFSSIIISRFAALYLMDEAFTMCILFPSGITWGICSGCGILYYVRLVLMTLTAPFLPLIIATIIGTLLLAVSSRFRHSNLVTIILGTAVVVAIIALSFRAPEIDNAQFNSMNAFLMNTIYSIFPMSVIYHRALCEGSILMFAAFLLIHLVLFVLFMAVMTHFYKRINTAVTSLHQRSDYKVTALHSSGTAMALYKKELRRYFSSPVYVMNTATGPVMMIVLALAIFFCDISSLINIPQMEQRILAIIPFITGFCAVMNATTSSSISLEGSGFWQLLVLPVTAKQVLNSKRWINFTLSVPAIIISGIIILCRLAMSPVNALFLFLIPLAGTWYTCEAGLYFNLKWPNFTWKSETAPVKQSVPVMISIFSGMILIVIPFLLIMMLDPRYSSWILCGSTVVFSGIAWTCRLLSKGIRLNHLSE